MDTYEHTQQPPYIVVETGSPEQTMLCGAQLGALLQAGDLVVFFGSFGVGKTHFIKGIAQGLGCDPAAVKISPSLVPINQYDVQREAEQFPIFHIDLYRLDGMADFDSIGLEECWSGYGLCLIEWAERASAVLPAERLVVELEYLDTQTRRLRMWPYGERYAALLARLKERYADRD